MGKSKPSAASSAAAATSASTNEEEIRVKVSALEPNPSKLPPIIGYFPSRYDPSKTPPSVGVYKHTKRSNRFEVKVKPNESDIEFIGTNYSGEASRPQLCSYALGVFDKTTNTLKMVPIAANKIFRLDPKVGDAVELEAAPQKALTGAERTEAVKDLQLTYSTKKSVREFKKISALRASDDAETRQDLDKTLEGRNIPEEALEAAVSSINERNVPPYDLDASDPSRAYPLERIIFKGEWDHLLDVFNICERGGEVTPEVYPSFVCNRVHKLERIENEKEKKKLSGIFSYITHLIKFKDKNSMDGVRSATHHKMPGILFPKFSSMFVDPESKFLSTEKIELLVGYILVLTLFVDDFRTDLTDIAKDLRMPSVKLRSYYETLGCKLVREKQVLLATLPVPLKFPSTTRRKRRRT